jgi:hypothetical protein
MLDIDIRYAKTEEACMRWISLGYIPIECSFGETSYVIPLETQYGGTYEGFDHHGKLSHLSPVSWQAINTVSKLKGAPFTKFVVTGSPDLDACFAILTLSSVGENWTVYQNIARDIYNFDVDPIGRDATEFREGLLFKTLMIGSGRDALSFYKGVCTIRDIIKGSKEQYEFLEKASIEREYGRKKVAMEDLHERGRFFPIGESRKTVLTIYNSRVWGFDHWFSHEVIEEDGVETVTYTTPIVVALVNNSNNITIGCPSVRKAVELFGDGGLLNLYPLLGEGWGGNISVGGSPRGQKMTEKDLYRVAEIAALKAAGK